MLALAFAPLQAFCTQRSHLKPTTNMSSITPGNWTSCCGRTLRNAASSEASRVMRIFEASSNGVQAEEGEGGRRIRSATGHSYAAASDSAAERPGSERLSRLRVKGVDELLPNGEPRSNVGPTRFCWFTSALCSASELRCLKSSIKKYPLLMSSLLLASQGVVVVPSCAALGKGGRGKACVFNGSRISILEAVLFDQVRS